MKYPKIIWIFLVLLFLSSLSSITFAAENDFQFRVEPIFPESQIAEKSYYHFKGKPGETVTLQAKIMNDSNKELTVQIRSLNAYSGNQGIVYQEEPTLTGTSITNDSYQFKKVTTYAPEVTLGPLESKIVEFSIKIPEISGTILGSMEFRVFQGTEELTQRDNKSQLLIDQYKAFVLGVQVDVTNYKKTLSLSLKEPQYSPEQMAILIPIENVHPAIVPNITGTYQITKRDDKDFSIIGDIPSFKMAPMTIFHYPISWLAKTLEPGDYHVTLTLNVNGNIQTYKESLSIKNEEVIETQEQMEKRGEIVVAPRTFPWTTVIIGILVIIIIILILKMGKTPPKEKDK